jgi:hypothetical protein
LFVFTAGVRGDARVGAHVGVVEQKAFEEIPAVKEKLAAKADEQ